VLITPGQYTNLKVTTPEDMFIAERLMDEAKTAK
jgi:2-C-methyl-D-erythritol 4-phosphate cytidylyltransferase